MRQFPGTDWEDPFERRKAYDLLVQCEAGLVSITGTPDTPVRVGISIADIAAGMYAYTGVLAALYHRPVTGIEGTLEVSLFDSLAEWMGNPAYYAGHSGASPIRSGANHPSIAPYGPHPCSDGRSVFLGVQNEREWASFCEQVLLRPDLISDSRFLSNSSRVANRAALDRAIAMVFTELRSDEVIRRLESAGIANARMNSISEFLEHRQLGERDRWRVIGSPVGDIKALIPPVVIRGLEPRMGDVPALGQHTAAVMAEFAPSSGLANVDQREG